MKKVVIIGAALSGNLGWLSKPFGSPQLQQVLEKIGLEKTDVDAIVALPDDAKDFTPDTYTSKVSSTYENKLLNDPTFLGKITIDKLPKELKQSVEAGQYGRFMNEFKALATKQGLDLADLSEEDAKSLNKTVTKVFEKYSGKLGSSEALVKLQADLSKALSEKAEIETSVPTKLADLEKKLKGETATQITKLVAATELAGIKGLSVKPKLVVDSLLNTLNSKYTLVPDGIDIKLMQKENPQLKAMDSAGKEITFAAALKAEAIAEDLIGEEKEEDETKGKGTLKVDVTETGVKLPKHIQDRINANLALESKK